MNTSNRWTDYKLEQIIGNLLRAGVVLAAIVVLAGGIIYLMHHGGNHADYHQFKGVQPQLRSMDGVIHDALALDSAGIIQLGLLLLILTPIARVVFSAIGFVMEGDRMYLVITLIVLGVLIASLVAFK